MDFSRERRSENLGDEKEMDSSELEEEEEKEVVEFRVQNEWSKAHFCTEHKPKLSSKS